MSHPDVKFRAFIPATADDNYSAKRVVFHHNGSVLIADDDGPYSDMVVLSAEQLATIVAFFK